MASKRFNAYSVMLISLTMLAVQCIKIPPWNSKLRQFKTFLGYPKGSLLNFTETTAEHGYISEEHRVVTEDGYILTMFRIVRAKNCLQKKRSPPVLLMHGLLHSSDSWIDSGPSSGLYYLISDACFDLWVGNNRGNYYSREHILLNPDKDSEYWNFYIDEFGRYDLPAIIDYILDYTHHEKLNYIGFSQGAGTFLIMCSERPGYCEKAQIFIALGAPSRLKNTKSVLFRGLLEAFGVMEGALSKYGVHEVFRRGTLFQKIVALFCQLSDVTVNLCAIFFDVMDYVKAVHSGSIAKTTLKVLFEHFPAGSSLHNVAYYGRSMKSNRFEKFNYGKETNLVIYGSEKSPEYNLSAVTVPVVSIYGTNDGLVDIKDVKWLMSKLPNVIESVEVKDPLWNHMDVMYSQYTADNIFPKIRDYLLKYTYE